LINILATTFTDYFPISTSTANTGSSHNERYYEFIQGPIHFFVLDSIEAELADVPVESAQAIWLKEQLAVSTSPWKIVYFHHPPYSSGKHRSSEWMQWSFAAWGLDAVLSGHDHTFERLTIDNIPYFVNGLGGRGIRDFVTRAPNSEVRYNDNFGAMRVSADETQLVFAFYAVDNPQQPIDVYTIQADTNE
jgi:tartrate-resistant acid phosphatase type 5